MAIELGQHQVEITRNRVSWEGKPLLRQIYAGFYDRILGQLDRTLPGRVVEIGSGIGNLKSRWRDALATDLFPNPWLDLTCDGYELPFADGTLSHLILFDVLHHLEAPAAFFGEAARVLVPGGRVIVFDPYISVCSHPIYGLLHHEPVAMGEPLVTRRQWPRPRAYYAAQGNATRLFFRGEAPEILVGWKIRSAEAMSVFSYLLSGGFSKPAVYPASWYPGLCRLDRVLSRWPRLFGGRCLVCLQRAG